MSVDVGNIDSDELSLILAEMDRRRRESPIEFLDLLPIQQQFDDSQALIELILGGNRCLGGESEIYDPIDGIKKRIDTIDKDFYVYAWDGFNKVIAKAEKPFKKEIDDLYEIELSNGEKFTASLNHLVLTPFGYLSIFDCLLKCAGVLLQSTSESCQSITSKGYLAIINLRLKRKDVKWDFTVPIYHNYILAGAIHHNSGKTTPASKKVLRMGLEKKRKVWVCGETFQDSIAIQQKKMSELVPRHRIKYGNYDDINGFTNRKLLIDNGTLYTFKSYDQGREAFQGDDIDIIWCDEEPPLDIIKEMKMRLIDRNGILIITMTSLKGITDFIRDYFEDCDILERRWAPLVKKELPVRARKGPVDIFFLWTTDNQHIDQNRLMEEVKLMPETDIMCRIYGMPTNLAGKIYMSFGRESHVISIDDVPTTGNQLWNVLDPHDRKPWAIGWYLVNKNGSVYCIDEYPGSNFNEMLYDDKTYEDYAKIIKDKEAMIKSLFNIGSPTRRVIDPNFGNKTMQLAERQGGQAKTTPVKELQKLGLIYKDGIDALEAGHLEVRKWLHWEKKNGQYVVRPGIYFCSNCINHINHLTRYSRKDIMGTDGDVKDKVGPRDAYKDFCDLVRYLLMANPKWIEQKVFNEKGPRVY